MKKVLLAIALTLGLAGTATAQQKVGHINIQELLAMMPEQKSADDEIQKYAQQLENDLTEMQTEYQTKLQNAQANQANWTQLQLQTKSEELQSLQQRIIEYQQSAQQDIQRKQYDLQVPIIEKIQNAVNSVGKENGFAYIFDVSQGSVIYTEGGEDVMALVKAELGIK
jgi:outer membrane protein